MPKQTANKNEEPVICYPLRMPRTDWRKLLDVARQQDLSGAQLMRRLIRNAIGAPLNEQRAETKAAG